MNEKLNKHLSTRWLIFMGVIAMGILLAVGFLQSANTMTVMANATEQPQMILADLEIMTRVEGSFENNTVRPGGPLTYTIRYTNTRSTAISGVTITDSLGNDLALGAQIFDCVFEGTPPPESFVPPVNCSPDDLATTPYQMKWVNLTIPGNSSGYIILHTTAYTNPEPTATMKQPLILGNSVQIGSGEGSGSFDTTSTVIVGPLLKVSKTVAPALVKPGHLVTYTLTALNLNRLDSIPAHNIVISDVLPEYTTFYDASPEGYFDEVAGKVVFKFPGPLNVNETYQVWFRVQVDPNTESAQAITNAKNEYVIRSEEIRLNDILGNNTATTRTDKLLTKTAIATKMSSGKPVVYPDEEVTYTLTVYNPLTITLAGVIVSDTLPGTPDAFIYVRAANSDPEPEVIESGRALSWTVDLPPWGSVSRSFVVRIPRMILVGDNKTYAEYDNTLSAYHPAVEFHPEDGLARVRVMTPLVMTKVVSNAKPQPGETIFYTITLSNNGVYPLTNLRITDTIDREAAFGTQYLYMAIGPQPVYTATQIVWADLNLVNGMTIQIAFAAYADGRWLSRYCNRVDATSTDALIPSITKKACITIDSPVKLGKVADPNTVFPGETFEYLLTIYNSTLDQSYTIDKIVDYLTPGFTQIGGSEGNPAILDDVNEVIGPDEAQDFIIDVMTSVPDGVSCAELPKTFKNEAGAIRLYFTEFAPSYVVNAGALAPLRLNPHVVSDLIPFHQTVMAGDFVTYTLSLFNGSPVPAESADLTISLPFDVHYIRWIGDNDPTNNYIPYASGDQLTWTGVFIAPQTELLITFLVQVDPDAEPGAKKPYFYGPVNPTFCFGKLGTGDDPLGTGVINVAAPPEIAECTSATGKGAGGVVLLTKTTKTARLPVDAILDYTLSIANNDYYTTVVKTLTDTLPTGFQFIQMMSGITPTIQGNQLIWKDIPLDGWGSTSMVIRMRAGKEFKYYDNWLAASAESPVQSVCSKVLVYPYLALLKDAAITETVAGSIVPYTITLLNLSSTAYASIQLTDTLEAGFTFLRMKTGYESYQPTLSADKTQIVWKGLKLAQGCSGGCKTVLVFEALVSPTAAEKTYYNLVEASSPSASIPSVGPTAPVIIHAPPVPRIALSKQTSIDQVYQGGVVTYTIRVSNTNGVDVTQLTITDMLPANFTFLKMISGPDPAVGGNQPSWQNLTASQNCAQGCALLVFEAQVPLGNPIGEVFNNLQGSTPNGIVDNPGPSAPVIVLELPDPQAALSKQASVDQVFQGGVVTYTVWVSSTNGMDITQLTITDTLPTNFTFLKMISGPEPVAEGRQPIWQNLTASRTCTQGCPLLVFEAQVPLDNPIGEVFNNLQGSSPNGIVANPGPSAPVTVLQYIPELPTVSITKQAQISQVVAGGFVPYVISIANNSGKSVSSVNITDTLPSGFVFVGMTAGISPTINGSNIIWNNLSAYGGCSQPPCVTEFAFNTQVLTDTAEGEYFNILEGSSTQANIIGGGAMAPVTVIAYDPTLPEVWLYKQANTSQVNSGGTVSYTITITYANGADIGNLLIIDTLPNGLIYQGMIEGPEPLNTGQGPKWDTLPTANCYGEVCTITLVFDARVLPTTLSGVVYNSVTGSSTTANVNGTGPTAPITITYIPIKLVYLPIILR